MKPKIDTILIIEDDPGLIELINEKIQECGYPTICFQTAASAFEWLENNTPILMMLDYRLPDMNAQEFIGTLKNTIRTVAPFVVATGQGDEKIAVEMMKLGAKEYIVKDSHFLEMLPLLVSKSISEIEKENKLLITEQKFIELSQFNKQIIENAHEGIIVYDRDSNYLTWNPFMEKITGVLAIDVIGKNAIELFPFLEKTGEKESIRLSIEERKIIKREFEFNIPSTEKTGWVSQTSGPLFNFEGQVIGTIATVHDLTMRKKAEKALELAKQSYIDIINSVSEAIYVLDENATFIDVNEGARKMYQMSNEELIGKTPSDIAAPRLNNLDHVKSLLKTVFETGTPTTFEFWGMRKNGEVFPKEVIVNKGRFFEKDVLIATARDITERKKAENVLQKNEALLKKALSESSNMIQSNSDEVSYQQIADSFLDISGAKYLSFNIFDENGLDFTTVAVSGIKENLLKFTSIIGYEVINKRWQYDPIRAPKMKDKTITIFNSLSELTNNVIPKPISTILEKTFNTGTVSLVKITNKNTALGDFTLVLSKGDTLENTELIELFANQVGLFMERKKAEKALNESEALYRNLVQRIPDGVYKSTPEGKFVDINPAMVKILGYDNKEELLKINIKKELYFDESHRDSKYLNPNNEEKAVFELRKKDGSGIWVEDHGWYNFDENGVKLSHEGILRDITERKKAEEVLNEKMDELMRFHRLMVGRELTMIELKKEINGLLKRIGETEKYRIVE